MIRTRLPVYSGHVETSVRARLCICEAYVEKCQEEQSHSRSPGNFRTSL